MVAVDGCVHGKQSSSKIPTDLIHSQTASTSRSINSSSDSINSSSESINSSSNSISSRSINRQEVAPMTSVHTSTSSSRSGSSGDGISCHSIDGVNASKGEENTEAFLSSLGTNFKILKPTDPVRELQTIIRDKNTSRSDFVFYADRLVGNTWISLLIS